MAKKNKNERQRAASMGQAAANKAWFSYFKPEALYDTVGGGQMYQVKDEYKTVKKAYKHFKSKYNIEVPEAAGDAPGDNQKYYTFGQEDKGTKASGQVEYALTELANRFQAKFKASLKQQSAIRGRIQARKEAAQRARYKIGRKPIRPVLGGGSAPRFYPETMTRDTGVQY